MQTWFNAVWTDAGGTERHAALLRDDDEGVYLRDWDGVLHGPYADDDEARAAHPTLFSFAGTDRVEFDEAVEEVAGWVRAEGAAELHFAGEPAYVADDGTLVPADDWDRHAVFVDGIEWECGGEGWVEYLYRVGVHYFVKNSDGELEPLGTFESEDEARDRFGIEHTPAGIDDDGVIELGPSAPLVPPDTHRWRPDEPDESDIVLRIDALVDD